MDEPKEHGCPLLSTVKRLEQDVHAHENKLDVLIEIASRMGRIEERIEERNTNQHSVLERIVKRLDEQEDRILEFERTLNTANGARRALLWVGGVIAAVAAILVEVNRR